MDTLDEAYRRLHRTGPEFEGWLSNHGPMAVEALVHHGHDAGVHRWLDSYLDRLDELPRGVNPIDDWRAALGDPKRTGDWLAYFARTVAETPWRTVLATWWPRLLPGIAASATHGVIRVGHAVRALRDHTTPDRVTELGQALAYWAARWQPVPGAGAAAGTSGVADASDRLPRVPCQDGGIRDRLTQLSDVPGWPTALAGLRPPTGPDDAPRLLAEVVHRASLDFLRFGHANPVMLVHTVTAPTAVLRTLPELAPELWLPSLDAAWSATAAVTAAYAPAGGATPPPITVDSAEEAFDRASRNGDEHVVKLADAVVDVYAGTGDRSALAAAVYAAQLI
ncbi:questin oxidase family protein [Micromonospora pisi]|uniref:questin oxidase family protein n=1 Tax=Micromonospora pisi TaxID=589240 RepID=UPI00147763AA